MNKYSKLKTLVQEQKYQLAYDEYSKIINESPKAYDAYFERALIDCYYLRENYQVSKEDLLLVFNKNKKLAKRVPMFLTIICDTLRDFDNAIYFGELALKDGYITPEENLLEVHFALSRSYYMRGASVEDYTCALGHIDACSGISDELSEELMLCKCDILLILEKYDDVLKIVDHLFFTTKVLPVFYYFKARALYGKASSKEDFKNVNNKFKNIFYEFSLLFINNMKFDDEVVQQKVESLQKFISKNYYECSNEVLKSLGELYIQDDRFKSFIDSYQEGTALFISKAIDYYCLLNK